ncbi:hypothetical protein TRFO_06046 [Tritrichomonas foetus]|uniref:protein-tyrosine-phosphatase n=1 Tax=Tritrichomonas foetus TaxID=1144522 RepID=A0A1J4K266_9EUKA|nr:hypothetical protein TRFO_06046 [Tritrichomonas foetus]|eukprot:OHT05058.1 hypothetical protein TRFO_06046 [Tritrichomonas foetus]
MKRVTTPSKSLPASEIQQKIEIIPDKVYFLVIRLPPKSSSDEFCFSVDANQEFQYLPFFYDFGPPSLLQIHKFYHLVVSLMKSHSTKKIVYMTSSHASHLSNGVLFITSFRMLFLKLSADEAYSPCNFLSNSLKPYRDASTLPCTYDLTVLSCLKGLQKAMELGWYNLETFNQEEWEKYEQVENGDMNWLIPGKLMAFATPYNTNILNGGWRVATPKDVLPIFKKYKINHVIRLCQKFYNEEVFKQGGLKHSELYFLDGTTPPMTIREKFLKIIESDDVVALHCKAGLGRTFVLSIIISFFIHSFVYNFIHFALIHLYFICLWGVSHSLNNSFCPQL